MPSRSKKIARRSPILPRPEILRLAAAHTPIEGRSKSLRLDFNENTVGCSPAVRAALSRLSPGQLSTYPEYERVRRLLARHFRVAPAELLLTNGADDALRLLIDSFASRASEIFFAEPTFPMYRFYASLAGARIRTLPYDARMRFPLAAALKLLARPPRNSRPRIFLLANPNNPTGTLLSLSDIKKILAAASHTLIVLDEAYVEFSSLTALPWIRRYPNLVVVRTFSKAAGLASLRLGCLFANRTTAALLRRAQPPFPVNALALVAAEAALRNLPFLRRYVREVTLARTLVSKFLSAAGIPVFPSAGNFLLADFGPRAPAILRTLKRRGILLRDRRSDFARIGPVRITIGTRSQMRRLLRELAPCL